MKRALLVLALLAMVGVWPSGAHAWQWKRTTVVFDTTTSVPAATLFFTSAISTGGASVVVVQIFSSDTCAFCGDSGATLRVLQGSEDGTNFATVSNGTVVHGALLTSDIASSSNLNRTMGSSAAGGRHYVITPTVNFTGGQPNFIAWPYMKIGIVSTNHAGFTNRYHMKATVYVDQ